MTKPIDPVMSGLAELANEKLSEAGPVPSGRCANRSAMKNSKILVPLGALALLAWMGGYYCGWHRGVFSKVIQSGEAEARARAEAAWGPLRSAHLDRRDDLPVWELRFESPESPEIGKVDIHALTGEIVRTRYEARPKEVLPMVAQAKPSPK